MPDTSGLDRASAALDDAEGALRTLDERCCEPGRSPRMAQLAGTLTDVRNTLSAGLSSADAAAALADLEDAGGQLGRLQVGCCAPDRLPLYAEMLERLTAAQLGINESLGRGH